MLSRSQSSSPFQSTAVSRVGRPGAGCDRILQIRGLIHLMRTDGFTGNPTYSIRSYSSSAAVHAPGEWLGLPPAARANLPNAGVRLTGKTTAAARRLRPRGGLTSQERTNLRAAQTLKPYGDRVSRTQGSGMSALRWSLI